MLKAMAISAADGLPLLHAKVLNKTAPVISPRVRTHGKKQQGSVLLLPGAYTASGHQRSGLL